MKKLQIILGLMVAIFGLISPAIGQKLTAKEKELSTKVVQLEKRIGHLQDTTTVLLVEIKWLNYQLGKMTDTLRSRDSLAQHTHVDFMTWVMKERILDIEKVPISKSSWKSGDSILLGVFLDQDVRVVFPHISENVSHDEAGAETYLQGFTLQCLGNVGKIYQHSSNKYFFETLLPSGDVLILPCKYNKNQVLVPAGAFENINGKKVYRVRITIRHKSEERVFLVNLEYDSRNIPVFERVRVRKK